MTLHNVPRISDVVIMRETMRDIGFSVGSVQGAGLQIAAREAQWLFVPLEAYPAWLRAVAEAMPFRAILHGPSRMLLAPDASGTLSLLELQLGFGLAALVPLALLYRAGMRRVTSYWMRLPTNFPMNSDEWQVVMQMKQTDPATNVFPGTLCSLSRTS